MEKEYCSLTRQAEEKDLLFEVSSDVPSPHCLDLVTFEMKHWLHWEHLWIGPAGRFEHLRLKVRNIQLDDQLPCTASPVVLSKWRKDPKKGGDEPPILNLMIVKERLLRHGRVHYPSVSVKISPLQIDLHERLIWRVLEMVQLLSDNGRSQSKDTGEQASVASLIVLLQSVFTFLSCTCRLWECAEWSVVNTCAFIIESNSWITVAAYFACTRTK